MKSETKENKPFNPHPNVSAWTKWLESDDGTRCKQGQTFGTYLENRLWRAFMAGYEAGERKEKD